MSDIPDDVAFPALPQRVRVPGVPFLYAPGLALLALAMVLLPLAYVALVGAVAWAVYWHAVHHAAWISNVPGFRLRLIVLLFYGGTTLAGMVVVFFLLKPFLARRPKRVQPLALNPGAEPHLYAFVESVCRALRAPPPGRIDLSADLNASAGFRRGLLSLAGTDFVLTLGLPFVSSLTVGELAAMVGHEFGHFRQGMAMRTHYVVTRVQGWFARVVHQRDSWDESLSALAEDPGEWWIGILVWTAQLGVGLSRLFLRVLMHCGAFLSAFLSRQMEYHADACACAVAGSETVERLIVKSATLDAAFQQTFKLLRQGWNSSSQLPDNLPELLRRVHHGMPDEARRQIADTLGLHPTRWYDTHPSPGDRIRQIRRAQVPAVLQDDRPATVLFSRFDIPARQVTALYYTDELELLVTPDRLVPLPASPEKSPSGSGPTSYREVPPPPLADTLLLGCPELLLPLLIVPWEPQSTHSAESAMDPEQMQESLKELVLRIESVRPQLQPLTELARKALLAIPAGSESTSDPATGSGNPDAVHLWSEARRSAHEVIAETGRRLELGLRLALPDLDSSEVQELRGNLEWLAAAATEYEPWRRLGLRCRSFLEISDPKAGAASSAGDPIPALTVIRSERAGLNAPPGSPSGSAASPRRLRVGATAAALRELDAILEESNRWMDWYWKSLEAVWAVAGRAEARATSRPS